MNHPQAQILAARLVTLGLGSTATGATSDVWPIHCHGEPQAPDNCITLYDTDARQLGRRMWDGVRTERLGVQLRVRSALRAAGRLKAEQLALALDQDIYQDTVTISGSSYLLHAVYREGSVVPVGTEAPNSKRWIWTVNAVLSVKAL